MGGEIMDEKICYIQNDVIINIGEWDYQEIEIQNDDGTTRTEIQNPLPEDATEETRTFDYSDDRGWCEVGQNSFPTDAERITNMETVLNDLLGLKGSGLF